MKPSFAIPLAIIMGGLIVAAAVYLTLAKPAAPGGQTGRPELVRPIDASDHILGNPAARVRIVEYSDFNCEFCKNFDTTLHQIVANEGADGDVAWVFRHFPLTEIHPDAPRHARAAECAAIAGGNEAFWKYASILFKYQPANTGSYGAYASEAGLAGDAFSNCFSGDTSAIDARIAADRKNALDMGARGTPFSVILVEGKEPVVMDGAYPYDAVKQLIDQALAQ